MRVFSFIAASLLIAIASPASAFPICSNGKPSSGCVVDGDTIWHQGAKIRLVATDAPETANPSCSNELSAGRRARKQLASLLDQGYRVRYTGDTDRYGRALARIFVSGRNVEGILLRNGLTLRYEPGYDAWLARKRHWCGSKWVPRS
jgi:endonuclease YncB( thermonuclease family)